MTMAAIAVVGAAAISYSATQDATNAATNANNTNIAYQQRYNEQVDPFSTGGNRAQYVGQLNDLMKGGYSGVKDDPMYKQLSAQGMEATQRAMASRGQGMGTNDILAINKNQTGTMMDYFNQQYSRLADLSGASRGGSRAVQGMDPTTAGSIAMANGQAAGQALGGIASIYGSFKGGSGGGSSNNISYLNSSDKTDLGL
jgi:hypothetical protein